VHVVFPLGNQDVGGIRTRSKASGLRFHLPELYAGEHEVDFEAARPLLRFFVSRGYNIGESSALALYACMQMLQYGVGTKFVVILADGIQKYSSNLDAAVDSPRRLEVTLEEASSKIDDYGGVLWTHATFVPRNEGIKVIASSLGCEEKMIRVARARDVQSLISGSEVPASLKALLPNGDQKLLLVCMAGGTSLHAAEILAKSGVKAQSLAGGITDPRISNGRGVPGLVQPATE
jgi:rhodanese-related sulfurtransferase